MRFAICYGIEAKVGSIMTERSSHVIKPPIEDVYNGRVFRPLPRLRYKRWLKFILASVALYFVFLFSFFGPPLVTVFVIEFIPLNLWFVEEGWVVASQVYWIVTPFWLVPALVWTHLWVNSIEYSVVGWQGETMPEIYQKKGIITVTKKHVPFRTITNVKSRVGIFDRGFGIGAVKIETAGESGGMQATGVLTLILKYLLRQDSEEVIEGIVFYEELKEFILRELRGFERSVRPKDADVVGTRRRSIFTENTLRAFQEIRDTLREERGWRE